MFIIKIVMQKKLICQAKYIHLFSFSICENYNVKAVILIISIKTMQY